MDGAEVQAARAPVDDTAGCADAGPWFAWRIDFAGAAKEVHEANAGIFYQAAAAIQRCTRDPDAWYGLVRSGELAQELPMSRPIFPVRVGRWDFASLLEAAKVAASIAPDSPMVASVYARVANDVELARREVERFPNHRPLRVALARAQLQAGTPGAAVDSLSAIPHIDQVDGATTVLAQARLAIGDFDGALAALKIVRDSPVLPGGEHEPDARSPRETIERFEVEYRAQLALGRADRAVRPLFDASEWGSEAATSTLRSPPPQLEKAIELARARGALTQFDRSRLRDARSDGGWP